MDKRSDPLSLRSARPVINSSPSDPDDRGGLDFVDQLIGAGRHEEAVDTLRALPLSRENPTLVSAYLGWVYFDAERYSEAIASLSEALADERYDSEHAWLLRGQCYEELERYELAIADYLSVVALAPEWALPYAHLGYCSEMLGRGERAAAFYRLALCIDPNESLALISLREFGEGADADDSKARKWH